MKRSYQQDLSQAAFSTLSAEELVSIRKDKILPDLKRALDISNRAMPKLLRATVVLYKDIIASYKKFLIYINRTVETPGTSESEVVAMGIKALLDLVHSDLSLVKYEIQVLIDAHKSKMKLYQDLITTKLNLALQSLEFLKAMLITRKPSDLVVQNLAASSEEQLENVVKVIEVYGDHVKENSQKADNVLPAIWALKAINRSSDSSVFIDEDEDGFNDNTEVRNDTDLCQDLLDQPLAISVSGILSFMQYLSGMAVGNITTANVEESKGLDKNLQSDVETIQTCLGEYTGVLEGTMESIVAKQKVLEALEDAVINLPKLQFYYSAARRKVVDDLHWFESLLQQYSEGNKTKLDLLEVLGAVQMKRLEAHLTDYTLAVDQKVTQQLRNTLQTTNEEVVKVYSVIINLLLQLNKYFIPLGSLNEDTRIKTVARYMSIWRTPIAVVETAEILRFTQTLEQVWPEHVALETYLGSGRALTSITHIVREYGDTLTTRVSYFGDEINRLESSVTGNIKVLYDDLMSFSASSQTDSKFVL